MRVDLNSLIEWATLRKRRPSLAWNKAIRPLLLIALSLATVLNAEPNRGKEKYDIDLPVTYDLRPKFALFSWTRRDDARRFALVANRESQVQATLYAWPGLRSQALPDSLRNTVALIAAVRDFRPDVLHSFSRVLMVPKKSV